MSNDRVGAPGDLQPQVEINFNLRASLSRTMSAPVIVDGIVGLAVFGNSSEIYLAHIPDKGGEVYERLGSVKATTYIHGWTVHLGKLYVLDGVELAMWDLSEGKKGAALNLVKDAEGIAQAKTALDGLKNAIQRVEWATLLEQAEDEWVRLTKQQSEATPSSDERDRLDTLVADYFLMLKTLRELTGSTGGAVAARTIVKTLRAELAKKRKEVAPWLFSPPVIRQGNFDQPQRAVFVVQGNGTLYTCDKSLTQSSSKKWREKAEPTIALMEDLKLIACISDNALRTVDTTTFAEKGSWTPERVPAEGAKHILAWANKQLWWSTEAGVQGCEVDAAGNLKPTFRSGQPWTTRQVGRLGVLSASYGPAVNPNDLFDTMNINAWLAKRPKEAGPLNDGIIAQLMLSDENGKYNTPAEGFSQIVHGPFAPDPRSAGHGWTQVKAHALKPLVILSDSRGASVLCKYPTPGGVSQLLPQWSLIPWLSSVSAYSDLDRELSREWPTPQRRPLPKPFPDMAAYLKSSPLGNAATVFENLLTGLTKDHRKITDRDLRLLLWHGLFNRPFPPQFFLSAYELVKDLRKLLYLFFNDADQQLMRNRFMSSGTWSTGGHNNEPGTVWDWVNPDNSNFLVKYLSGFPPVDFDPPWVWKTPPTNLFHSAAPAWYDPWGYNRPGDFFPHQPSANYLMPFCFDGNLRFPQRPITFEGTFKGRSWAMFTDNDPTSILANAKPATRETERQDPVLLQASNDPSVLVVTADDDHQRTNFQLLATKAVRITFDVFSHMLRQEISVLGSNGNDVMGSPTVYKARSRTFPTAWCVVNAEFASARLRKLAAVDPDTGVSPWIEFVEDNVAQYGPKDGGKAWQIDKCPLPQTALPTVWLHGYNLPASS